MKDRSLSPDQIEYVCSKVAQYIRLCSDNCKEVNAETVENSSLLRRLLSGLPALPEPPPERFGLPAYELVEGRREIEVQSVVDDGEKLTIDQHSGYVWLDRQNGIIQYPRLNIRYAMVERDVVPDPNCVTESDDPCEYKYTAKFLQRLS